MRKTSIFLAAMFICCLCGNSQNKTFETNIKNAKIVNAGQGITKIERADTVIVQIVSSQENQKSALFVTGFFQEKDSAGDYITTIKIGNPKLVSYMDVSIVVELDSPFKFYDVKIGGVAEVMSRRENNDKKGVLFSALRVTTRNGIIMTFKHDKLPFLKVYGVDGIL